MTKIKTKESPLLPLPSASANLLTPPLIHHQYQPHPPVYLGSSLVLMVDWEVFLFSLSVGSEWLGPADLAGGAGLADWLAFCRRGSMVVTGGLLGTWLSGLGGSGVRGRGGGGEGVRMEASLRGCVGLVWRRGCQVCSREDWGW